MVKNISERIVDRLLESDINIVFTLTGGGAMFLNDAFNNSSMKVIYCHHEQACAMAAVGYYKATGKIPVVVVTTGCGSTNTITGVLDAFQDYVPVIFISGQVNVKDTSYDNPIKHRQIGVQESNIIDIVKPITKYSVMIRTEDEVERVLNESLFVAKSKLSPV